MKMDSVLVLLGFLLLFNIDRLLHSSPIPIDEWKEAHILASGYSQRHCQPIPENMTLCQSVGYDNMVLPNYFHQESLQEAVQQSNAWLPLLRISCHPEVKRFLCSLYAPVCLKGHQELKIVPCKSLCLAVQESCLPLLQRFGFGWPQSLNCERFPVNDGLCISSAVSTTPTPQMLHRMALDNQKTWDRQQQDVGSKECSLCSAATISTQTIFSQFCQSDFVLKSKIRRATSSADGTTNLVLAKKIRQFKPSSRSVAIASMALQSCTCSWFKTINTQGPFLIGGRILSRSGGNVYEVTYLLPWQKENREFKQAIRRIRRQGESICKESGNSARPQYKPLLSLMSGQMRLQRRSVEVEDNVDDMLLVPASLTDKQRERRRRYRKKRKERCKQDKTLPGCRRKKKRPSGKKRKTQKNEDS